MMQRCNHGATCSCGGFSVFFSAMPPNNNNNLRPFSTNFDCENGQIYPFAPPSAVDCTLSLGTPSTRLCDENEKQRKFCWDNIFQTKKSSAAAGKNSCRSAVGGGADAAAARRCANCDTTSTPLWRNGPRGPKSLCNACGIRFKKEERRATAAAAAASANGGTGIDAQPVMINNNSSSWAHHHQYQYSSSHAAPQKLSCYPSTFAAAGGGGEFRFTDGYHCDSDVPFLSWRLNLADRPSFVHDFTR